MVAATLVAFGFGCGGGSKISTKTTVAPSEKPVIKDATREELLDKYNLYAQNINTVNATVVLKPTAGSKYSGVIEEYHEVKAFLLASRPANIRVIGQAPVIGTTVFDMASDGETFRVSVPSKNKFLVGQVAGEFNSSKPIENLRPQHLLDAVAVARNPQRGIRAVRRVQRRNSALLRADSFARRLSHRDFAQDLVRPRRPASFAAANIRAERFARVRRPLFRLAAGRSRAARRSVSGPVTTFAHNIRIDRPHDDYRLDLQVSKIVLNSDIPADRFKLEQPAGSELVHVAEAEGNKQP